MRKAPFTAVMSEFERGVREDCIKRITANSSITRAQAERFSTRDLQVTADGLRAKPVPAAFAAVDDADLAKAAMPMSMAAAFAKRGGA